MSARRVLAQFSLPAPVEAASLMSELVDRMYGTGAMISFDGPSVSLYEPVEGLGPRKLGRLPKVQATGGALVDCRAQGDVMNMTLEESAGVVSVVAAGLAQWFEINGGINYVTGQLVEADGVTPSHNVTVQRAGGKTPHQLYAEALRQVETLSQQLRDNGIEPL